MNKLILSSEQWQWIAISLLILVSLGVTTIGVGAYLENNDNFCTSCHTEPETLFVSRAHQSTDNVDSASFHAHSRNVRCIDCHSGNGIQGRIGAMVLGSRDMLKFVIGRDKPAVLSNPMPDKNCTKCHQDISQNQAFSNHMHSRLADWKKISSTGYGTCASCHSSHTTDGDKGFLNKQRAIVQCKACHRVMGE